MKYNAQAKHLVEAKGPGVEGTTPRELLLGRRHKYLIMNCLARRARELNRGERSRVDLPDPHTHAETAIAEVLAGKMKIIRRAPKTVLVSMIKND
jgi:DNA-directed RNA polymerase subunit K/omega